MFFFLDNFFSPLEVRENGNKNNALDKLNYFVYCTSVQ